MPGFKPYIGIEERAMSKFIEAFFQINASCVHDTHLRQVVNLTGAFKNVFLVHVYIDIGPSLLENGDPYSQP